MTLEQALSHAEAVALKWVAAGQEFVRVGKELEEAMAQLAAHVVIENAKKD